MTTKALSKYLSQYAESFPEMDEISERGPFSEVVFVPLCGEDDLVDRLLQSLAEASESFALPVLVILVVNDGKETFAGYQESNQKTLSRKAPLELLSPKCLVATLNRTGLPLSGVGIARKLGGDFALQLHARGLVKSPWIHTTDADALVAKDYFQIELRGAQRFGIGPVVHGAAVHPYQHTFEGDGGKALFQYDAFLRYYSAGLAFAGSPYSYPTIGSCLSFSPEAYAMVRGFPKKEAGEDFYFLHKLAKTAFVWEAGGLVTLPCRASDRVPFGTGQSIKKIQESTNGYFVYDPKVFTRLREWLRAMDELAEGIEWNSATGHLGTEVLQAVLSMGAQAQNTLILNTRKDPQSRKRHWDTWFDGFKTLRFIHLMRQQHPSLPWSEVLQEGFRF
jgi:hypothetical protein